MLNWPKEPNTFFAKKEFVEVALEVVEFPVMMISPGKGYVPAPNVPPVVVMTPVAAVYEMTEAPEREVELTLLLKDDQSPEVRHPAKEAEADWQPSAFAAKVSGAEMVVVITEPLAFVERSALGRAAIAKEVVVAAVPVARAKSRFTK